MTTFSNLIYIGGEWVAELEEGTFKFRLNSENPKLRIANMEKDERGTSTEQAVLAELNRRNSVKVKP
jgi:hypothetical protein